LLNTCGSNFVVLNVLPKVNELLSAIGGKRAVRLGEQSNVNTQKRRSSMALTKRGKTWHTHFYVRGQRFRQSLDTTDWREAQKREKELISRAEQGIWVAGKNEFACLSFSAGGKVYLDGRTELAPSSQQKERQLLVKPRAFFGERKLSKISASDILTYREWRKATSAGPAIINMEVGLIRRILKKAKRWSALADEIRPLKEPRTIGQALSPAQKDKLLFAAATKPEWQSARLAMELALCTTMRGVEIKNLHWGDVDLANRLFLVRRSKTDAGVRTIPMNHDAFGTVMELKARAAAFRGLEVQHYLFPACEHGIIDPTRHQKSWRTAWRKLTAAAGVKGFRFHDCRHQAITELAESTASDATIMSIAGHVSRRMLEHYSHIRQEAKRDAVSQLSARPSRPDSTKKSYDTNNDTKSPSNEVVPPYVIEGMVGTRRLELLTSTVSR
jgi:integrase